MAGLSEECSLLQAREVDLATPSWSAGPPRKLPTPRGGTPRIGDAGWRRLHGRPRFLRVKTDPSSASSPPPGVKVQEDEIASTACPSTGSAAATPRISVLPGETRRFEGDRDGARMCLARLSSGSIQQKEIQGGVQLILGLGTVNSVSGPPTYAALLRGWPPPGHPRKVPTPGEEPRGLREAWRRPFSWPGGAADAKSSGSAPSSSTPVCKGRCTPGHLTGVPDRGTRWGHVGLRVVHRRSGGT